MNKNLMKVAFVGVIALIAGINVYNAQKTVTLSDIAMENVEALAMNEINPNVSYGSILKKCRDSYDRIIGEICESCPDREAECDIRRVCGDCFK